MLLSTAPSANGLIKIMRKLVLFPSAHLVSNKDQEMLAERYDFDPQVYEIMRRCQIPARSDEQFIEDAFRIQAALKSGAEVWIADGDNLINAKDRKVSSQTEVDGIGLARVFGNPGEDYFTSLDARLFYRPEKHMKFVNRDIQNARLVSKQYNSETLMRPIWHAGLMDTGQGDTGQDIRELLLLLPYENFFVKNILHEKYQPKLKVRIPAWVRSLDDVDSALTDAGFYDCWEAAATEGKEAYAVTEWLDLKNEWRFFVVGGQIVSGSPSLPELTPDLAISTDFDALQELAKANLRNDLLSRYLSFAQITMTHLAKRGLHEYALDIAYDTKRNKPVVIELNDLLRSGLFGNNPAHIINALVNS